MFYKAASGLDPLVYKSVMKQNNIHQEILLWPETSFTSGAYYEEDDRCRKNHLIEREIRSVPGKG
jgi:hypothetical protein